MAPFSTSHCDSDFQKKWKGKSGKINSSNSCFPSPVQFYIFDPCYYKRAKKKAVSGIGTIKMHVHAVLTGATKDFSSPYSGCQLQLQLEHNVVFFYLFFIYSCPFIRLTLTTMVPWLKFRAVMSPMAKRRSACNWSVCIFFCFGMCFLVYFFVILK